MRTHLIAVGLLLCVGCSAQQQRKVVFNESEYSPYLAPGTAKVVGQAFLKTKGGDVKYAAGDKIYMHPVTSYSEEWYSQFVIGGRQLSPPDSRIFKYVRTSTADGSGNFEFADVPPGDYFVDTTVIWMVDAYTKTGGVVCSRVHVGPGAVVKTVVTR